MADSTGAYEKGQLYQLELAQLQADPNQPRKSMDPQALEELTASVKTYGIIQPLLFRVGIQGEIGGHDPYSSESGIVSPNFPDVPEATIVSLNSGPEATAPEIGGHDAIVSPNFPDAPAATEPSLFIVAGERRFEAAKAAGLTTVPAILVEGNTSEIALVENLLRQDLTSVEEAEALQRLKDEHTYTDEQLSGVIGKARTTISDIMLINRLPLAIRDECRGDQKIGKSVLIEIARKKQERAMTTAYNAYKAKQQKAVAARQKKDPNDPQVLFDLMDKTMTKLRSIDTTAWADEARANFQTALVNLKEEITTHQLQ